MWTKVDSIHNVQECVIMFFCHISIKSIFTSPIRVAKYCDEYVCLFVHPHNSKTTLPNFTKFFMHVVSGCGLSADGVMIHYILRFYG